MTSIAKQKKQYLSDIKTNSEKIQKNALLKSQVKQSLQKFIQLVNEDIGLSQELIKVTETLKSVTQSCKPDRVTSQRIGRYIKTTIYFKCTLMQKFEKKQHRVLQKQKDFLKSWEPIHEQIFGFAPLHPDTGKIDISKTGTKLVTIFDGSQKPILNSKKYANSSISPLLGENIKVPFDKNGFPIWNQWTEGTFQLKKKLWFSSDNEQFHQLNQELYKKMKTDLVLTKKVDHAFLELIQKGAGLKIPILKQEFEVISMKIRTSLMKLITLILPF
jgi:hypothetical protein